MDKEEEERGGDVDKINDKYFYDDQNMNWSTDNTHASNSYIDVKTYPYPTIGDGLVYLIVVYLGGRSSRKFNKACTTVIR